MSALGILTAPHSRAGSVTAGTLVLPQDAIAFRQPGRRYVSRGGDKLQAALVRFGLDVGGRRALDAGASTGGFTDCLLAGGALHVIAVDVGYGQLDWGLREDRRVTVLDRTNIRDLDASMLPYRPEVVVADLAFISLVAVLPALVRCAAPAAHFVLLVKPQFEARREEVKPGGVVADPSVWRRVLQEVAGACRGEGVVPAATMASPVRGPAGNMEFLIHAARTTREDRRAAHRGHEGPAMEAGVADSVEIEAAVAEAMAMLGG